MCEGIPIFSNNKKALFGVGTNSHSISAESLKIDEDNFRKYEYHWWDKELVADYYDDEAERILAHIDKDKAFKNAQKLVKDKLSRQKQIIAWLKKTPEEWDRLIEPKHRNLAKKVNPKILFFEKKLKNFKVSSKTNPYKATKLPPLKTIKKFIPKKVVDQAKNQIWDQVLNQVGNQVRNQIRNQIGNKIRKQVWNQIWDQVGDQVVDQVKNQVNNQTWDQVKNQIGDQIMTTSYWAVKFILRLPIKHWFFDFLKLGIIIVFVKGKVKVFGKAGKFLGEYDEVDFNK